ncbi:MAG: hypothetical protein AB7F72_09295 [Afipia sp.]
MSAREDAHARHQQKRWLRPDAHRWVRSDVVRFLVPGAAASVYSDVERKYSPNQPRVPAGSGRESGRWTDGNSGGMGGGTASPTAMIDFGSLPNFSDLFSLFQIAPTETDNSDYTQLAGDVPEGNESGTSQNHVAPEIPKERPDSSSDRKKVRIPVLKHYDISGWYSKPNLDFGGLTPRDYLRDKGAAERRQVGLDALIRFGVLKP